MKNLFKKLLQNCDVFKGKTNGFTLAEVLITLGIIGIVAAITVPTLISNYKKQVTEVRLQQTWSILNNAINMAKAENGDVERWDFSLRVEDFIDKYFKGKINGVFKGINVKFTGNNQSPKYQTGDGTYLITLPNNIDMKFVRFKTLDYYFLQIYVDINGFNKKPNKLGLDRFYFYLVPKARSVYNTGNDDALKNVTRAGLYYDGYGMNNSTLKTNYYRGCSKDKILNAEGTSSSYQGAYCIALIAKNNWKIPDNYPRKF